MEHYRELGVSPSASAAEIRSSYLRLARQYHPDRLVGVPDAERAVATDRMARINAAWAVLSDRSRRAHYDASRAAATNGATVRDVGRTWSPYGDADDPIDPRLLDDTPTGAPTIRRSLTFVPAALAAAGLAVLMLGFVIGLAPLLAVGGVLLAGGGLAFLLLPLLALANSSRADRHP